MRQVATLGGLICISRWPEWGYRNHKTASHSHENELFISVWSRKKVL